MIIWYQVNEFLAGAGTDAPEVDEENMISRPSVSYDDLWAKTLLESEEVEVRIEPNPDYIQTQDVRLNTLLFI